MQALDPFDYGTPAELFPSRSPLRALDRSGPPREAYLI